MAKVANRYKIPVLVLLTVILCAIFLSAIWEMEDNNQSLRSRVKISENYSRFQDFLILGDCKEAFDHYNKKVKVNLNDEFSKQVAFNSVWQFWIVAGSRNSISSSRLNSKKIELTKFETLPAFALKSVLEMDYKKHQLIRHDSLFDLVGNCSLTTKALINCYELIASTAPAYDTRLASHILRRAGDLPLDIWDNLTSLTRVRSLAFNKRWSQVVDYFKFVDDLDVFEPEQGEVYWLYVRALQAENETTRALHLHKKLDHAKIPIPPDGQPFFDDHKPPEPELNLL